MKESEVPFLDESNVKEANNNMTLVKGNNVFTNDTHMVKEEKKSDNAFIKENSFNFSFSTDTSNKHNKLRTERHNILGGILGCDLRIKSNQIKINSLDKSTFRKHSDNNKHDVSVQETHHDKK
jgi:hypothetical protein